MRFYEYSYLWLPIPKLFDRFTYFWRKVLFLNKESNLFSWQNVTNLDIYNLLYVIKTNKIYERQLQQIIDALATVQGGTAFGAVLGAGTPKFASGVTNFVGGAALVGERGAELVTLPRGANVIPANQTRNVLNSGGNKTYTFNITNAGDPMAAAYQVQREIARSDALASGI